MWTIVYNAFGEYVIGERFNTKKRAIEHVEMLEGSQVQSKRFDAGAYELNAKHMVIKSNQLHWYGFS